MENVLELKNINLVNKKEKNILIENINLTIKEGEKIILAGINGIGKSTLLKSLLGFTVVDEDAYAEFQNGTYNFENITNFANINQKVIYIEQDDFIQKPFTKVENALLDGIQDDIADKKSYLLNWLNKYHPFTVNDMNKKLLNKRVFSLSGGEKKYIAILQGLLRCDLNNIKLVLMDEPINNLDAKHIVQLSDLINRIQENNPRLAWIIISHCHVFTNVTRAFEIRDKKLEAVAYQSHNCFGTCDARGYYL